MNQPPTDLPQVDILARAARHARAYRSGQRPIAATATAQALRERFCLPLSDAGHPGPAVIDDLVAAAGPGLVGNTDPNFYAWVMGASNLVGVAADWLTSAWGQNAGIYQSSPAAAVAEEAVEAWLLDLLDLPRDSSVGFVGGATMATFVGLAAARREVLTRFGHDYDALGLQGAPLVRIYLSDDAHVANYAALRHLGFGDANFHRLPSDAAGLMCADDLAEAMAGHDGPKIVIAQAGHINSGGFEPLEKVARIARSQGAWMHVDGAFGLWVRASPGLRHLARGADLADSWSVDGHKWLQIPYASGFAIVRDRDAHRRAMQMTAGYLNPSAEDARDPSAYVPGLSRRAQGFAAWAVLRNLGRRGVAALVDRHCAAAACLASGLAGIDGLAVLNRVELNQIVLGSAETEGGAALIEALAHRLNADHHIFVRTALWKGRTVLRLSVISEFSGSDHAAHVAAAIPETWAALRPPEPTLAASEAGRP